MSTKRYDTSHSSSVLEYMKKLPGEHLTVQQVFDGLSENSVKIGLSTVYRQLKALTKEDLLIEYKMKDHTCYQYLGDTCISETLHCKCIICDEVFHIPCNFSQEISKHLKSNHSFSLDITKTVLYGECQSCSAIV